MMATTIRLIHYPNLPSPGDLDNDGVLDVNDLFPEDFREWADYDGDGEGDNADTDDDNDGWADTDEVGLEPILSVLQMYQLIVLKSLFQELQLDLEHGT